MLLGIDHPVIVDAGANLGTFAVPVGLHVLPVHGRVYAFEAQRQIYYQLCANLLINGLVDCHAMNLAVGAVHGQIDVPVLDLARERNAGALTLSAEVRTLLKPLKTSESGLSATTLSDRFEPMPLKPLDDLHLPPRASSQNRCRGHGWEK